VWGPKKDAYIRNQTSFRCGSTGFNKGCNKCHYVNSNWIETPGGWASKFTAPNSLAMRDPYFKDLLIVRGIDPQRSRWRDASVMLYLSSFEGYLIDGLHVVNYWDTPVLRGGFSQPRTGKPTYTVTLKNVQLRNTTSLYITGDRYTKKVIYHDEDGSVTGFTPARVGHNFGGWATGYFDYNSWYGRMEEHYPAGSDTDEMRDPNGRRLEEELPQIAGAGAPVEAMLGGRKLQF
jgi:hypothetical protein